MSGTATIDITQSVVLTILGNFLTSILPAGTPIVRGQDNLVSEPAAADFVVMTPMLQTRLATNIDSYADVATYSALATGADVVLTDSSGIPLLASPQPAGFRYSMQSIKLTVQCDFHGPNSMDNANIFSTLFRDEAACTFFSEASDGVSPLYTSDPRQVPFINAEANFEYRWSIDAEIQITPTVTTVQQFANSLVPGIYQVDATYPP